MSLERGWSGGFQLARASNKCPSRVTVAQFRIVQTTPSVESNHVVDQRPPLSGAPQHDRRIEAEFPRDRSAYRGDDVRAAVLVALEDYIPALDQRLDAESTRAFK